VRFVSTNQRCIHRFKSTLCIATIACLAGCSPSTPAEEPKFGTKASLTQHVDLFIGTSRSSNVSASDLPFPSWFFEGGDVIPGAVYPQGMLYWSPDTRPLFPGGYRYEDPAIQGFSLTHFSGRGCISYQDFSFMPVVDLSTTPPAPSMWGNYRQEFSHDAEYASPGYYQVQLDSGINIELTATPRTGMARWTYPPNSSRAIIINAAASEWGAVASSIRILPQTNGPSCIEHQYK
jgi:putative alpha-1,2-mannosidase